MRKIETVFVAGTLIVASYFLIKVSRPDSTQIKEPRPANIPTKPIAAGIPPQRSVLEKNVLTRQEAADLKDLQAKWLVLRPKKGLITEEHVELARQSVSLLSCGPALAVLVDYLIDKGIAGIVPLIDAEVLALFRSDQSAEACVQLSRLLPNSGVKQRCLESWSFLAGRGLSEADRTSLTKTISDPGSLLNIQIGSCLDRMPSDPESALSDCMEQLKTGVRTLESSDILTTLTTETPPGADFPRMEQVMERLKSDIPENLSSSFNSAKSSLFSKWGTEDPIAAANYILANSNRMQPQLMGAVVEAVMRNDESLGFDWLQDLPPGPFLDQAIIYATNTTGQSDVGYGPSRELAGWISDDRLREERIKWLDQLHQPEKSP